MRMYDIILNKREGRELSKEEIQFFIKGYINSEIPDYQISALLMAIYFKGLNNTETTDLTMSMAYSGDIIDLSRINGVKVDKHSTGGVGDTTSLIVIPLVAACGVPVAKMSGRGLGHTGGTVDKLDSIPGFKTSLSVDEFIDIVNKVGAAIIGQTSDLVPADKKLYALRDVTATVDNISLIASSIMSKKIASGADSIVLDVKTGSGAFMHSVDDSFNLAKKMVDIGNKVGRKTTALVTDMDQPLGLSIGNALEVKEAIEVLKGTAAGPLKDVSITLAAYMVYTSGRCKTVDEAKEMLEEVLHSGKGADKLKEIIYAQGGNGRVVDDTTLLPCARHIVHAKAKKSGYISSIEAQAIGTSALLLGAGRHKKDDEIDPGVGFIMRKRVGDQVVEGETLADFYVNNDQLLDGSLEIFYNAIDIKNQSPLKHPLIFGAVTENGIERWY